VELKSKNEGDKAALEQHRAQMQWLITRIEKTVHEPVPGLEALKSASAATEVRAAAGVEAGMSKRDGNRAQISALKNAISEAQEATLHHSLYRACEVKAQFIRQEMTVDDEKFVADVIKDVELRRKKIKARLGRNLQYILASSPEYDLAGRPVLWMAASYIRALGFENCAGDAKDRFHKQVVSPENMSKEIKGWRLAWQGKVIQSLKKNSKRKNNRIVVIALKGGPECEFERETLSDKFKKDFPMVHVPPFHLKFLDSFEDIKEYFEKGAPVPPRDPEMDTEEDATTPRCLCCG